jgi:multicomponent Na+:H+ antiporter subunit B
LAISVLFLAATGLALLLFTCRCERKFRRLRASKVLETSTNIMFPLIILLGAYIFIHGHLTPGGGFQGGAVIASAAMLMYLSFRNYHANHARLSMVESLAGMTFAIIGLVGLFVAGSFLSNKVMGLGEWNRLFSAGFSTQTTVSMLKKASYSFYLTLYSTPSNLSTTTITTTVNAVPIRLLIIIY